MTLRPKTNPEKRPAPRPPNGGRACGFASGKSTRVKHAPNLFFDATQIRVMKFSPEISRNDSDRRHRAENPVANPPKVNKLLRPKLCTKFTTRPLGHVQTLQNSRDLAR